MRVAPKSQVWAFSEEENRWDEVVKANKKKKLRNVTNTWRKSFKNSKVNASSEEGCDQLCKLIIQKVRQDGEGRQWRNENISNSPAKDHELPSTLSPTTNECNCSDINGVETFHLSDRLLPRGKQK